MRFLHGAHLNAEMEQNTLENLERVGVKLNKRAGMAFLDMYGDDPLWPKVKEILDRRGKRYATALRFTQKEVSAADWVRVMPGYLWGYPMPDMDGGYTDVSFSREKECAQCGIGREQTGPIRLAGEPKLGRYDFMAVNWIFDCYFARPYVVELMREEGITGFKEREVIRHGTSEAIHRIRQLVVEESVARIECENLVRDKIPRCSHIKYEPVRADMLRVVEDSVAGDLDLVRTKEWFGSGHGAFQVVLASARFVALYQDKRWKGLDLEPVVLVPVPVQGE